MTQRTLTPMLGYPRSQVILFDHRVRVIVIGDPRQHNSIPVSIFYDTTKQNNSRQGMEHGVRL